MVVFQLVQEGAAIPADACGFVMFVVLLFVIIYVWRDLRRRIDRSRD